MENKINPNKQTSSNGKFENGLAQVANIKDKFPVVFFPSPLRFFLSSFFHIIKISSFKYSFALHSLLPVMFAAPKLWNSLPRDIRTNMDLSTFKMKLKTFLFCQVFS